MLIGSSFLSSIFNTNYGRQWIAKYHPNKDINDVIVDAVKNGWDWVPKGTRHCKGVLRCTKTAANHRNCLCEVRIDSTPKNPTGKAKQYARAIVKLSC
ncbi:hypothetical protein CKA27_17835 [Vibrio coralliilyticus]|nr:hypothetical protein JV59_24375 [Vibrio coralliilyticus]PAT66713.1 hypothetical protein CKA27_17835 [Vibrio coralliilyticus]